MFTDDLESHIFHVEYEHNKVDVISTSHYMQQFHGTDQWNILYLPTHLYLYLCFISLFIYLYAEIRILIFTSVRTCRWQPDLHWWWSYGWLLPILLGTKPMWSVQLVWMLWWTPLHIFHHRGEIFFYGSWHAESAMGTILGVCWAVLEETFLWVTVHGAACNNSWIEIYENHWFVKQQLMLPEAIAAIITSFSHVFL